MTRIVWSLIFFFPACTPTLGLIHKGPVAVNHTAAISEYHQIAHPTPNQTPAACMRNPLSTSLPRKQRLDFSTVVEFALILRCILRQLYCFSCLEYTSLVSLLFTSGV